jgi:hypothetical protein
VGVGLEGEPTLSYDEAIAAIDTFADGRVIVSIADKLGNACAGVAGVLKHCLDVDADSETGQLTALDIGVDGVVILSRAAFVGASWNDDGDGGELLAVQHGEMLMTVQRAVRRPDEEVV